MPVRVYHAPSTRSTRVIWLLEEIGAEYDVTVLTREQRQEDDYKKVHPLGRVPAIDDGDGPIIESLAICLHITDQHPEAGLNSPLGSRERALVYQWSTFAMTELETAIVEAWRYEDQADLAEKAIERFHVAAGVVERALAGNEYVVSGRFSVADIILGSVIGFARRRELLGDSFPNCVAYDDRLQARPARLRANAVGS